MDVSFSTRLAQIIGDEDSGILLDATRERTHDGSIRERPNAAFEITSGAYQRYFVTLWRLFDKEELFEECMTQLSVLAKKIRARSDMWYDTIVTYTATAKHLMEHLHSRIEVDGDEIQVVYLSPYPYHNTDKHSLLDFSKRRVLILTDVIATGTLAKNLASVVERLGGVPVAVLSVIWTAGELPGRGISGVGSDGQDPRPVSGIEFGLALRRLDHYTLTTFPIPVLKPEEVDVRLARRINPATVLPEEYEIGARTAGKAFRSRFSEEITVRQVEAAGAIKFGLHEMDGRRFTSAFNFDKLLRVTGAEVWDEVKEELPDGCIVATTYSREDLRFLRLVQGMSRDSGRQMEVVYIPKTDSGTRDNSFFMLPSPAMDLGGKHIVLLLSTIHTAEKLQRLIALLTLKSISGVTVICLINRMGERTNEFITRIRKLLRGVRADDHATEPVLEDEASLRFIALHNVMDLDSNDLDRMQRIVQSLTADYQAQTREPSFRSLTELDIKSFQPKSVTTRKFESWEPLPLVRAERLQLASRELTVRSRDGKLFVLCEYAAQTRNYRPLIEALSLESEKESLYQLFAILLSQVSYLRMARQFHSLRNVLVEGIRTRQRQRLEIEHAADGEINEAAFDAIEHLVSVETYFLFGLSLFSYLDQTFGEYYDLIMEVLHSGLSSPDEWERHPVNFMQYYTNERVFWTLSMLMHFTHPDFRTARGSRDFRADLEQVLRRYKNIAERFKLADGNSEGDPESLATIRNKIKQNFDSLLREIGAHEQRWRHQVVRFLHRELIEPEKQHNPIIKALNKASDELRFHLAQGIRFERTNPGSVPGAELPRSKQVSIGGNVEEYWKLKRHVEDALTAAGQLEGISEAAARLFQFYPIPGQKGARDYVMLDGPGSLSADVVTLRQLLQEIRSRETVSPDEVKALKGAWKRVEGELSRSDSELIRALLWYVAPLIPAIHAAIEDAERYLQVDFGSVWKEHLAELPNNPAYVLMDRIALKEVLYNMFTNVRHGLQRLEETAVNNAALVGLSVEFEFDREAPQPEMDRLNYVCIRIRSPSVLGAAQTLLLDAASTFERQRNAVEQFGGTLTRIDDGSGVVAELRLVSRNDTYESWRRKEERRGRHV